MYGLRAVVHTFFFGATQTANDATTVGMRGKIPRQKPGFLRGAYNNNIMCSILLFIICVPANEDLPATNQFDWDAFEADEVQIINQPSDRDNASRGAQVSRVPSSIAYLHIIIICIYIVILVCIFNSPAARTLLTMRFNAGLRGTKIPVRPVVAFRADVAGRAERARNSSAFRPAAKPL